MFSGLNFFKRINAKEQRKKNFAAFYKEKISNSDLPNCPITYDVPVIPYCPREPRANRFSYHIFELVALLRHLNVSTKNPLTNQRLTLDDIGTALIPDRKTIKLVDDYLHAENFTRDDLLEYAGYSQKLYDFLLTVKKTNFTDTYQRCGQEGGLEGALAIVCYIVVTIYFVPDYFANNCLPDNNSERYQLISSSFIYKTLDVTSREYASVQLRYSPSCDGLIYKNAPVKMPRQDFDCNLFSFYQKFRTPLLPSNALPDIKYFPMPVTRLDVGTYNIAWVLCNVYIFITVLTEKKSDKNESWYFVTTFLKFAITIFSLLLATNILEDPMTKTVDLSNECALACNAGIGMRFIYNNGSEINIDNEETSKANYVQCENGEPTFSRNVYVVAPLLSFFAAKFFNKKIFNESENDDDDANEKVKIEFANLQKNNFVVKRG